ncbi:MAG: hypothetical protein CVT83_01250 [Alphaproteobacteria bacterium HGW-Alphaproteobacteria-5]|nr:MAG: hypothetical protein CVT83_01250 [Alphaproteobacteria bacterium HGW-Alphaproteobacteria-5]
MPIKTIVAGVALEADTDPVLERALQLAQMHEARLVLVHVLENLILVEEDIGTWSTLGTLRQTLEDNARAHIGRLLADRDCQNVDVIVDHGRAHESIEATARAEQADLLVIGPGNPNTLRERLFGSTADRLTRNGRVPVLVVRTQSDEVYRRVTIAMDFSPSSQLALEKAVALTPASMFEIVHVVELPLPFEQAMLKAGTPANEIDAYRRSKAKAARSKLNDLLADMGLERLTRGIRLVDGTPADIVAGLSREETGDLLALGSHGRNVVSRALLGSVTRRALHSASRDILVVAAA